MTNEQLAREILERLGWRSFNGQWWRVGAHALSNTTPSNKLPNLLDLATLYAESDAWAIENDIQWIEFGPFKAPVEIGGAIMFRCNTSGEAGLHGYDRITARLKAWHLALEGK